MRHGPLPGASAGHASLLFSHTLFACMKISTLHARHNYLRPCPHRTPDADLQTCRHRNTIKITTYSPPVLAAPSCVRALAPAQLAARSGARQSASKAVGFLRICAGCRAGADEEQLAAAGWHAAGARRERAANCKGASARWSDKVAGQTPLPQRTRLQAVFAAVKVFAVGWCLIGGVSRRRGLLLGV